MLTPGTVPLPDNDYTQHQFHLRANNPRHGEGIGGAITNMRETIYCRLKHGIAEAEQSYELSYKLPCSGAPGLFEKIYLPIDTIKIYFNVPLFDFAKNEKLYFDLISRHFMLFDYCSRIDRPISIIRKSGRLWIEGFIIVVLNKWLESEESFNKFAKSCFENVDFTNIPKLVKTGAIRFIPIE